MRALWVFFLFAIAACSPSKLQPKPPPPNQSRPPPDRPAAVCTQADFRLCKP